MNNLKKLREDGKYTRVALSKKCGIPVRTILAWEKDERRIELASYISVIKIARALDVTPNDLFAEDSDARVNV